MGFNSDLYNENVPVKIQKALLRLVFDSCKSASEHCYGSFQSNRVAKDVSGFYRRGMIEDQWPGLKTLFKKEISVEQLWFKNRTGSYYELTCGIVKLTQSCVLSWGDIPREAEHRATLATNGQYEMFVGDDRDLDAEYLYSILTYGIDVNAKNREEPAFIKKEFPNGDCTRSLDDGIDLIKKFPDIALAYMSKPSFDAAVKERPKRKRRSA